MKLNKNIIAIFLTSISSLCYANLDNKNYYNGNNKISIENDSLATLKEVEKTINKEKIKLAEINIAPKNTNNVSHNKFDSFSIGSTGVRLNNREENATYIINEVVNGPSSRLSGNIGVIGNAAHVIIANPSGIICDNCGFTNTLSETLVSGRIIEQSHANSDIAFYSIASPFDQKRKENYGTVNFNNNRDKKTGGLFSDLTIISKGININDNLTSENNINIYNGQNVIIHANDNSMMEYQVLSRPTETRFLKAPKLPKSYINYLDNSEINADKNINIFASYTDITNNGHISSDTLSLSLKKEASFINKKDIYIYSLDINKDEKSKFINELDEKNNIKGQVFYLLTKENHIKEILKIKTLINNESIINHNKYAFRYLPTNRITIKD